MVDPRRRYRDGASRALPGAILRFPGPVAAPLVPELWSADDLLDQAPERIAVGRQPGPHLPERLLVRNQQTAAQGVGKQLLAQVVGEIALPLVAEIGAQALEPVPLRPVGERRGGLDRPSPQVARAALAYRPVPLERQADRVEA